MTIPIDITFDFQSDTPPGADPDARSPTLREYHKILWSKPLPNGNIFNLDGTTRWAYLHHKSNLGEFFLTSDTTNSSFRQVRRVSHIREQIPEHELSPLLSVLYTIGNMIIFPGRQIEGKWTINQARGCHGKVGDRFDLTLECIRLHYLHQPNPLKETLIRYADFFHLFEDFQGYVDFFLLHDLVTEDCSSVKFFLPFVDFSCQSPYPESVDDFRMYIQQATRYIEARNDRILEYARTMTVRSSK